MPPSNYDRNVFINCPFDARHTALLRAMTFAIHDCGFIARCALESEDSGEVRIRKIIQIIRESRYSIHDISRIELDTGSGYPRFNMPLELGICLGAREFGHKEQRLKACLVLDRERYRYQACCSDIAGQDIRAYAGKVAPAIQAVRNFLANQNSAELLPSGGKIVERFKVFQRELARAAEETRLDPAELTFSELRNFVAAFTKANPW